MAMAELQHSLLLPYIHPVSPQPGYSVAPVRTAEPARTARTAMNARSLMRGAGLYREIASLTMSPGLPFCFQPVPCRHPDDEGSGRRAARADRRGLRSPPPAHRPSATGDVRV